MADYIRIFCQSAKTLTRRELADFIIDGVYFDQNLRFEPFNDSTEIARLDWDMLHVHYEIDKRPIIFQRNIRDEVVQEEIKEILRELAGSNAPNAIIQNLSATYQIIAIEYKSESLTDDAWAMMDSVEAYLAQRLDGIIFVSGEGLYDKKLQLIYKL
jgi:hypothetical protein